MLKRKIKKLTKSMLKKMRGVKPIACKTCNQQVVMVPMDTKSVICAICVQKLIAAPTGYKKVAKTNKPRGWHFKKFFEQDGVVYSEGKIVLDAKQIKLLRKQHEKLKKKKSSQKA